MTSDRKDTAVERDERAIQPGIGGTDRPEPGRKPLRPPGGASVEDGQRELEPDVDRPKPDAGDATL